MSSSDPSTIAQAAALRKNTQRWSVRVMNGGDLGKEIFVTARSPGRLFVGTSEACDLRLSDRRVSRRHLALEALVDGLRITDLGSTNGTRIAGLRVGDAWCQGGEPIVIGDTTLTVSGAESDVEAPDTRMAFGPLIGASLAMRRLYRTCDSLAASSAPLVIEGEEGTGKACLAEAIHLAGPRKATPFVVVEGLDRAMDDEARAELFGSARGGTLFVRDISSLATEIQRSLVRVVTDAPTHEVRIIASTRRDLDTAVERAGFVEELARELVTRIELPPLRERRGDIALLVERFCRDFGTSSEQIPARKLADLNKHDHPGNVRELRRTVASLLADSGASIDAGTVDPTNVADAITLGLDVSYRDILEQQLPFAEAKQKLLDRFSTAYVTLTVAAHGGHVARAAAASGLAPRYFNVLRARGKPK